ncbi:hypothetical protein [Salinimicrobium sp. WS361]|uniref:hypothetical protein n=1 Tax=Salinimicrobium sp. WS361 TaxID=3425123 RepID=UPI003D6FC540
MKTESEIQTVTDLEQWLKDNCYSMNSYSINGNSIDEGYILENIQGIYEWNYTERGEKQKLEYFPNEKAAVEYALKKIKADEHANRNYIGMYKSDQKVEQILAELRKRRVEFWTDKIHYKLNDWRTRIFVIGCDIKKVTDLIQDRNFTSPRDGKGHSFWTKLKKIFS